MRIKVLLFMVVVLLLISACGGGAAPEVAEQPAQMPATETPVPKSTETPAPTDTPEPTATPESTWLEFTSEEGNFVVSFPIEPSEQVMPDPDFDDEVELHIFMSQTEDNKGFFGVSYRDYPQKFIDVFVKNNLETYFDSISEEALDTMGGVMISKEDISLNGFPGRRVSYEIPKTTYPKGGEGVTHSYLVGTRRYEILALSVNGGLSEEDIEQFFSSFQLLELPKTSADDLPSDAASDSAWVEFSSAECSFNLLFPTTPTEQSPTASHPEFGPIKVYMFTASVGQTVYMASCNDYPDAMGALDQAMLDQFLDGAREGALNSVSATLVEENKISYDDYPGREITFEIPSDEFPTGGDGQAHIYIIGNRFYQLMAMAPKDQLSAEETKMFLDSFQLIEPVTTSNNSENVATSSGAEPAEELQQLFETLRQDIIDEDFETAAGLTRNLMPDEACIRQGLQDEAAEQDVQAIIDMYDKMLPKTADAQIWSQLLATEPDRSEVHVYSASTEEIAAYKKGSTAYNEFPGGASELAQTILRPGLTFYEVEYVEPGKDMGMKYHLFFHTGERWCMLGPAWRALSK